MYSTRTVAIKNLFPYHSRTMVVVCTSVSFHMVQKVAEVRSLSPTNTHGSTEALYIVRKCSTHSRDSDTCYVARMYGHEGMVNTSFGAEDGLQQL